MQCECQTWDFRKDSKSLVLLVCAERRRRVSCNSVPN